MYETLQQIKAIQAGDEKLKEAFVKQNEGLIYALMKRFSNIKDKKDDLFQVGCIGLMKAINNFDSNYKVAFSTYAVPLILGEMKRYFRDNASIHINRSLKENYFHLIALQEQLSQIKQREVSYQELAEYSEMELSDVILAFEAFQSVKSIDEACYDDQGDSYYLSDYLKAKTDFITIKLAIGDEIARLTHREQLLLYYRYELDYNQARIASKLNVSQVQVSRMEKAIIQKLRSKIPLDNML